MALFDADTSGDAAQNADVPAALDPGWNGATAAPPALDPNAAKQGGLWDNFKLGLAGISDLVTGGTSAAETFTQQTADAQHLTPEATQQLEGATVAIDQTVVRQAEQKTINDIKKEIPSVFSMTTVYVVGGILLVAIAGGIFLSLKSGKIPVPV